jgi:heme-degrading monooxygenase HmoA
MFVVLWEFEVKPGSEECFQNAYGPEGAWVWLFQSDPHFQGSQLVRDPSRPRFYFTLDCWDSEIAYKDFLSAKRAAYEAQDHSNEGLTLHERHSLSFVPSWPSLPAT